MIKQYGAAIDGVFGNWQEVAKDVVEASAAIGLAQTPEEIGWLLVYRALIQAMLSLLEENRIFFYETPNDEDIKLLHDRLNESLASQELLIDQDFFDHPKDLPILATIKTAFGHWLQYFNFNQLEAQAICDRNDIIFLIT